MLPASLFLGPPAAPLDSDSATALKRNPRWAVPRDVPGLANFHQVSPTLYRGGQPTENGLAELRRLGVKTVVSLRAFHGEREMVAAAGLGYERASFEIWHAEEEDMRVFLKAVTDPARQPVFVHCQRGADRTGAAVAVYRACVEGWSRDEAIDEMVNGGYHFAKSFSYLAGYVRSVDCAAVMPRAPAR